MRVLLAIISSLLFYQFGQSQVLTETTQVVPGNLLNNGNPDEIEPATDPEINKVISIVNKVEETENFIDRLLPDSNASLPLGIIKQIGGNRYVIAIDSMKFKNNGAYFSAYAAIDFPGSTKKLAFRSSNVKFNPSGVIGGEQARLYLVSDHWIKINSTVSLFLSGKNQNWVEWDCNGFKAINLVGNFIFKKTKLIPDSVATTDSVVRASFQLYTEDMHNFIAGVSITPFKIAGLKDWSFRVNNAVVDMSELSNANTMIFPTGYQNPNLLTPQMWTGFALQSLQVKLPREISKTGKKTEIVVNNLLIDNMGVTGFLQVNNLFNANEGSMHGWDFSIDELGVGFTANQISSGHLKGKVQIPVIDSAQSLQYVADLSYNSERRDVDYNFVISPTSNVRMNVFSASVFLNKNSRINVSKINGFFKPTATLNGLITFDHENFNSNSGQLAFQNLVITTEAPYVTNGIFSLNNLNGSQVKTNYYPLTIDDITFGISRGAPILGFNVRFNLTELASNPLSVGTSILLKGKIEPKQQYYPGDERGQGITFTKTRWSFDRVIISGINVDIQTAPFTLKGNVLYRDDMPQYGTGFFGGLDLSITKVIEDPIGSNVGFGSKEDYRYFFIDAKVPARYIIPGTPIGLSRIIGGLYYHMKPNKTTETDFLALNGNYNSVNGNALFYIPDKNTSVGLKAGATGEFIFNEAVCNGEFLLDVNFTNSGGLGQVSLTGNMYSLASISKKADAPIKGKLTMLFDHQTKTFDALAQVNMSYRQIISGTAYFKAHFDPQVWYVCIGKPSNPCNARVMNLVNAPVYFMTGNSLEPCIQPPASISAESQIANIISKRDQSELQNGKGFVAGGRIHSQLQKSFGFDFFNVSGDFNFDLGFDMMMTDYKENATCGGPEEKVGVNGRVAKGDMYLAMHGKVGINGHFKFPKDCPSTYELCVKKACCCETTLDCLFDEDFSKTIFEAGVTAVVSANVPRPLYFDGKLMCDYDIFGKVNGSFEFTYEYGSYCAPTPN